MMIPPITIRYTSVPNSLGQVLVAMTQKGICQLTVDDTVEPQVEHLRKNFPHAEIIEDKNAFIEMLPVVLKFIDHPTADIPIPLDIHGTPFQLLVWQALGKTRPGETITYSELAHKIGKPSAVRAVANANGANKIAILIPCHRIIRSDGNLGGYRWGLKRKQMLLNREKQQINRG